MEITDNGKSALKLIFTDFLTNYNSYNIKGKIGLSNAGSLKLLRSLNKKGLLVSNKMGNAIYYKPDLNNEYLIKLLELIFLDHSNVSSFVNGWIHDVMPLNPLTRAIVLFGSILRKGKEARDVDVCFILKSPHGYPKLQSGINEINKKSRLKIHPLFLTKKEFENKLHERDKPIVEIVKTGIVVYGQSFFVGVLKNVQS